MSKKRIEIDGKYFRERRGKLVEIPVEWVGRITTPSTIRKRPSKLTRKVRSALSYRRRWSDKVPHPHGPPSMTNEHRQGRLEMVDDDA